ncbi:phosphate 1 isoform X2 [Wolffia australiana]
MEDEGSEKRMSTSAHVRGLYKRPAMAWTLTTLAFLLSVWRKGGEVRRVERMVKFSKELEAQLIPEWKDAFVDYRQLKKHVKKIKISLSKTGLFNGADHIHVHGSGKDQGRSSIPDPFRVLIGAFARGRSSREHHPPADKSDGEDQYEVELVQSGAEEVREFFDRVGRELDKVNNFYKAKEAEFIDRNDLLNKQLQILSDLKHILDEHRRRRRLAAGKSGQDSVRSTSSNGISYFGSPYAMSEPRNEGDDSPADIPMTDELMAVLERNGITLMSPGQGGKGKDSKPKAATMRISIPPTTPSRTISAVTSMIWEDLLNAPSKEGSGGDYINRRKIQSAEKMIRGAFVELYRGLSLLKKYRSLNLVAFTKILKKFDKVSKQHASASYLKVVKRSHFVVSDKIVRAGDEVESIFTKHFAHGDRKRAMKFLRPHQPKDSHAVTFFVVLAHLTGIFYDSKSSFDPGYVETVYPVFSAFTLISLHIFLYGCNLLAWRITRINHNFIFEFSPKTALKHKDAFLICTCIMTTVVASLIAHLILLKSSNFWPYHPALAIPGVLLLLFAGLLLCPFNIFYRPTRICLLRVLRNIALSPFYKVVMVDFFMADQLTSQIPLLRHMEFTVCYFMAGSFRATPYEVCTRSHQYKLFSYIISFLPYYWRALQCIRRYVEEGYDPNHMANAGKYVSAMIAAAARMKYAITPTPFWLAAVVITSSAATLYQLYWDFVKDWGFFSPGSKNAFLRDELVLKNSTIYYLSIALNLVLRLAWVETVMRINVGRLENRVVDFILASLEVIRRGHWNYYRVENEHLNNVGKFRAVKMVPLPFKDFE